MGQRVGMVVRISSGGRLAGGGGRYSAASITQLTISACGEAAIVRALDPGEAGVISVARSFGDSCTCCLRSVAYKRQFRIMKYIYVMLAGVITGTVALVTVLVLSIPADVPGWLATYPIDASADSREIAAALSTPPTHLQRPLSYALYHWQTLIAGVLAFVGGITAFGAAFVGAHALREQTERQINFEKERVENDANDQRRQIASALAGEMRSFKEMIEIRTLSKVCAEAANAIRFGFSVPAVADMRGEYFRVFGAIGDKLGLLPVPFPGDVARVYALATSIFDAMQGVNSRKSAPISMMQIADTYEQLSNDFAFLSGCAERLSARLDHYAKTGEVTVDEGGKEEHREMNAIEA
ncbi:hypothetical protein ACW7BC_18320 [Azospirillum argentinense]